ncbi:MAG: site-specific integrase [Ignavibacterium sp.]|nr:MAG: site-specific integrase [Ignavibacterium sp.]
MFLSKHKNGYYYLYYIDVNKKRKIISTRSKTKSEANKFLSKFSLELKDRLDRKTIPINFKKMIFEFLKYSESVHSYNHTITLKSAFKEMLKYYGDFPIEELNKEKVLKYIQYRSRNLSPHTVKREIESLSSLFNWAIDHNFILENICIGIKRPRLPEKLPVFFTKWEFEELLNTTIDDDLNDIFIFAVNTGLRQMELIKLEWNQVNIESKTLILDNRNHLTKSKKIRSLPLNQSAIKILEKRIQSRYKHTIVFTYHNQPINQQFISHKTKKLIKLSGINPKLNFHSLRHTFASWLVQRGVSIYEVSKLLGHADIKTTQIYAHLRSDDLRNAVEMLD